MNIGVVTRLTADIIRIGFNLTWRGWLTRRIALMVEARKMD